MVSHSKHRFLALDGLRGVAIGVVVLFHAYSRWPEIYPYRGSFKEFVPFKLGGLGVQLFFLVSGFVILMTLEKCLTMREFLWRRWLRLFPAMALCSAIIFVTAPLLPERPGGIPTASDLVSGLIFVDPFWLSAVFGGPWGEIEGALWSLHVEVIFYLVFGGLYFLFGRTTAIGGIGALFAAALVLRFLVFRPEADWHMSAEALNALGFRHVGWFAAGALMFLHYRDGARRYLVWFAVAVLVSAVQMDSWGYRLGAVLTGALFAATALLPAVSRLVAHPVLLFFGFVSYPLYLMHENATVATTIKLGAVAPPWLFVLLPVPPILAIVAVAWLVARYGEGWVRTALQTLATPLQWRARTDRGCS